MMKKISFGKPIHVAWDENGKMTEHRVIQPEEVKVDDEGVIAGDVFLPTAVLEDMADKMVAYGKEEKAQDKAMEQEMYGDRDFDLADRIAYIPAFPANCPIGPDYNNNYASGPAMDLSGNIKLVDVYDYAKDEDINVVPNGMIHKGEFISIKQFTNVTMLGASLCKLEKLKKSEETIGKLGQDPYIPIHNKN